jgi:hypothetical protein
MKPALAWRNGFPKMVVMIEIESSSRSLHLVNRVAIRNIHVRGFVSFVLVVFMIDLDLFLSAGAF